MESKLLLEKELEPIFLEKFPAFPEDVKAFIVKYLPYFIIFVAVVRLYNELSVFLIDTSYLMSSRGLYFYINLIVDLITTVLCFLAFKPMLNFQRRGWEFVYYILVLNIFKSLIELDLLAAIFAAIVGFWVLFQIRSKYVL